MPAPQQHCLPEDAQVRLVQRPEHLQPVRVPEEPQVRAASERGELHRTPGALQLVHGAGSGQVRNQVSGYGCSMTMVLQFVTV